MSDVVERPDQPVFHPLLLALAHRALGNIGAAFERLEQAYEMRDIWVILLQIAFDEELRSDPASRTCSAAATTPERLDGSPG